MDATEIITQRGKILKGKLTVEPITLQRCKLSRTQSGQHNPTSPPTAQYHHFPQLKPPLPNQKETNTSLCALLPESKEMRQPKGDAVTQASRVGQIREGQATVDPSGEGQEERSRGRSVGRIRAAEAEAEAAPDPCGAGSGGVSRRAWRTASTGGRGGGSRGHQRQIRSTLGEAKLGPATREQATPDPVGSQGGGGPIPEDWIWRRRVLLGAAASGDGVDLGRRRQAEPVDLGGTREVLQAARGRCSRRRRIL